VTEDIRNEQSPTGAPAHPRRRRTLVLALAAVAVLAGGAGAAYYLSGDEHIDVRGRFVLADRDGFTAVDGGHCAGNGGYSDISTGTQIVVTDDAGRTVAVGKLGEGNWINSYCELPFAVDVPAGSGFYGIEVSHRGRVQYSADQLSRPLTLTLD
jgi:hypothetical protein